MRTLFLALAVSFWSVALVAGLYGLMNYETIPGPAPAPPGTWPASATCSRSPGIFTLVMAAHPRCPCTRASIEELQRTLERAPMAVAVHFLFFKPKGADWVPTDLWHQAGAIPGAKLMWDEDGLEAARFGAPTSGHVLLFDAEGKLLFSGGVTRGRGNYGPSKGSVSLAAWLTPGATGDGQTEIFGCPLNDPQSPCDKGNPACPATP